MKRKAILWAPLVVFLIFAIVVAVGLYAPSDRTIRSAMVGQPVPAFALAPAVPGKPGLVSADLARGQPRIVNVFASWCLPCIVEAPQLMELQRRGVPIDAIAIRDTPADVADFLARHGDPFTAIGADPDSRVQMALGSSGVPESFVVDGRGIIRHQHIGEIRPEHVEELIAAWEAAK